MSILIFDYYNTLYNPITGKLFRGTKTLLRNLKRSYNLILITTGENTRWKQLESFQLISIFNQIILCKQKKESLFRYLTIENPVIIGDRINSEIKIGKRLGYKTLLVCPNRENPIKTISNFLSL